DLIGVRQLSAREHTGIGRARTHLVAQPAVLELAGERVGVGRELRRVDQLLGLDLLLQLGWAAVRVDNAVDMLPEPEPQLEVALSGVQREPPVPVRRRRTWWRDRTGRHGGAARARASRRGARRSSRADGRSR